MLKTPTEIKIEKLKEEIKNDLWEQEQCQKLHKTVVDDRGDEYVACLYFFEYFPLAEEGETYFKCPSQYFARKDGRDSLLYYYKDGYEPPMVAFMRDDGPLVYGFVYHDFSDENSSNWRFYGYFPKAEEETFLTHLVEKSREVWQATASIIHTQTQNEVNAILANLGANNGE